MIIQVLLIIAGRYEIDFKKRVEIKLELGKFYRIALYDETSYRFRFKCSVPGDKALYERLDDYAGSFELHQIIGFKSIKECS